MSNSKEIHLSIIVPVSGSGDRILDLGKWFVVQPRIKVRLIIVEDNLDYQTKIELDRQLSSFDGLVEIIRITGSFGNPGGSRNVGIEKIKDGFVAFWDCDDMPNFSEIEEGLQHFDINEYDYLVGNFLVQDCETGKMSQNRIDVSEFANNLWKLSLEPGLWRFVFRREVLNNLRFQEISMGEDQLFLGSAITQSSRGVFFSQNFYTYRTKLKGQLTASRSKVLMLRSAVELIGASRVHENNLVMRHMRIRMLITLLLKGNRESLKFAAKELNKIAFENNQIMEILRVVFFTLYKCGPL